MQSSEGKMKDDNWMEMRLNKAKMQNQRKE